MNSPYLETVALIERLHRLFLEVVKVELDRIGVEDVNNVQALILFNIGEDEVTVGELTVRGYYLGSNVSYNLKKLVEYGYLAQKRSTHDRRSVRVRLSEKGLALHTRLNAAFERHVAVLSADGQNGAGLEDTIEALRALGRFWSTEARETMPTASAPAFARA